MTDLEKYGARHLLECGQSGPLGCDNPCTCGLAEAIEREKRASSWQDEISADAEAGWKEVAELGDRLREQGAQLARANDALAGIRASTQLQDDMTAAAYEDELKELRAQLAQAWKALEVYGRHVWPCDGFAEGIGKCPCGLDAVQRSTRAALDGRKP